MTYCFAAALILCKASMHSGDNQNIFHLLNIVWIEFGSVLRLWILVEPKFISPKEILVFELTFMPKFLQKV